MAKRVCLILNEVLSLNAQECLLVPSHISADNILNEVLSLNAQEFERRHQWCARLVGSSMKS